VKPPPTNRDANSPEPTPKALGAQHTGSVGTLLVKVKPRASKTRILGFKEGQLEISVAAPPVDGAANDAICRCLADALDVGVRAVSIKHGAHSRTKQVQVTDVSAERWAQWLAQVSSS
jgi:uncharacterized protein